MTVAFSDGTTAFWSPQSYISMLPGLPDAKQAAPSNTATILYEFLDFLAIQPDHAAEATKFLWGVPGTHASSKETTLAIRAALKWRLVQPSTGQERSYRLTEAGCHWVEATPAGYAKRTQRKRVRGGSSVTNNFYAPSNYVHGTNFGSMTAYEVNSATPEELLDAMRKVLELNIPWDRSELAGVRESIAEAVAKEDPSRAKLAIQKLRNIVGQLSIGVSGNFAYQLLVNYFS